MSGDRTNVCQLFARSAYEARHVYNLFRRHDEPELYCAVPEHNPVPAFLTADAWEFAGTCGVADEIPAGFVPEAASIGVHLNGFHLFMDYPRRRASTRQLAQARECGSPSAENARRG